MSGTFEDNLARAKSGDPAAVAAILGPELPRIAAFVRAHLGSDFGCRESPSDVVQSVYRDVMADLEHLRADEVEGFRAWVQRLARNKVANKRKYHHAERRDVGREVEGGEVAFGSPPQEVLAKEEDARRIEAAFAELSPEYRGVIVNVCMIGMSYAEAAHAMDRSEESIRKLIHRARAKLAAILDR